MGRLLDDDNRRYSRFPCVGKAEVYLTPDGKPQAAQIADLSLKGALLVLAIDQQIVRGTILEVVFSVNKLSFRVQGEVMVVRSLTTVGLCFTLLSQRTQRQLTELIEELTMSHAKRETNKRTTEKNRQARLDKLSS